MKYWFKDFETGDWEWTDHDVFIKIYQCLQECILWRGENPYDVTMGIDYESIFNSSAFLTSQLEEVLDKYRPFFQEIIQNVEKVGNKIVITLQFWLSYSPNSQNGITAKLTYDKGAFSVSLGQ